jgi:hypothetical protein
MGPLQLAHCLVLGAPAGRTLIWAGVFGGALMVLGAALLYIRRRFNLKYYESQDAAFRMEDLERMRESGEITEDEFRTLRKVALGLDAPAQEADNAPLMAPGEDDDEEQEGRPEADQ